MAKHQTLRIDSKRYEDEDDCLSAAAADVAEEYGIEGYDMAPRWEDEGREIILVDVPAWVQVTDAQAAE